MDLFLTLRNFDADGNEVLETGQQGTPVPVAKGWLRVSHRELDPELSLPYRPYHKHTRRLFLKPGEIVKVEVEIWPTSMVFKKGHRIRLDVQPRDGVGSQSLPALSRRLQHRHQHDLCRRRVRVLSAAAGDSERRCFASDEARSGGIDDAPHVTRPSAWHMLARTDVLAGLLFIAVAAFGLWVSRDYPVGTALRMGTGYVPRLLCWILLGLGAIMLVQGLRDAGARRCGSAAHRPGAPVAVRHREPRGVRARDRAARPGARRSCCWPASARWRRARCGRWRRAIAALVLIALSWAIFILGLGLTIPVWPEW